MVGELSVAADHEIGLEPDAGQAVVHARAFHAPEWAFGNAISAFGGVVLDAGALRNAGADAGAGDHDAIIVVDLDPVVVLQPDGGGVFLAEPKRITAAGERGHALRVAIGGMDMPLAMGCQVVQRQGVALALGAAQIPQHLGRWRGFVGGQMLAKGQIAFMVQVAMLAARERAPGHHALHVVGEGRVGPFLVHDARPAGAVEHAAGLGEQILEGVLDAPVGLGEIFQGQARAAFHVLIGAVGQFPVGFRREMEQHVGCIHVFFEAGALLAFDHHRGMGFEHPVIDILDGVLHPVGAEALLTDIGPKGDELIVDLGVIPGDHGQARHGLARNGLAFARHPVPDVGLRDLGWRVVGQGIRDDVLDGIGQMHGGKFAHLFRHLLENVPIAFGLPTGGDRR